jgi:hypothetical protein
MASGLEILGYFRGQLALLAQEDFAAILSAFQASPLINGEVSDLLGIKRQPSWERLKKLTELRLLERRGHAYRVSSFAREFVSALSFTLKSVVTGTELRADPERLRSLAVAQQGVEMLYDRGKIGKDEYAVCMAKLGEMKNPFA